MNSFSWEENTKSISCLYITILFGSASNYKNKCNTLLYDDNTRQKKLQEIALNPLSLCLILFFVDFMKNLQDYSKKTFPFLVMQLYH